MSDNPGGELSVNPQGEPSARPTERVFTRRFFLLTAMLAAFVGWWQWPLVRQAGQWLSERRRRMLHGPVPPLLAMLPQTTAGASAGKDYLRQFPDEGNLATLPGLILPEPDSRSLSPDDLRKTFLRQVQRDFDTDQVVIVHGWVVSRAEGRLFAMSALWEAL